MCAPCMCCALHVLGSPLDLTLTLTLNPNQVLGQQGLPSTPLELRRCLFLCSTALHCAAAASRCACTHEHPRTYTPCPLPRTSARLRTPPRASAAARLPARSTGVHRYSPLMALAVLVRAQSTYAARTHARTPARARATPHSPPLKHKHARVLHTGSLPPPQPKPHLRPYPSPLALTTHPRPSSAQVAPRAAWNSDAPPARDARAATAQARRQARRRRR